MINCYISAFLGAFGGVFAAEWLKAYIERKIYKRYTVCRITTKIDED